MHHILSESQLERLAMGFEVELTGGDTIGLAELEKRQRAEQLHRLARRTLDAQRGRAKRMRHDLNQQDAGNS